jgi:hypothetical protein
VKHEEQGDGPRWWLLAVRYFWASPNTALGLALASVGLIGGGQARLRRGVLEAHGPVLRRLFDRLAPGGLSVQALTLGHVVLARDARALESSRRHEEVHVRQYERWGPAFLPAYLVASLVAVLRGGDAYRHNRFERAAVAREGAPPARAHGNEMTDRPAPPTPSAPGARRRA